MTEGSGLAKFTSKLKDFPVLVIDEVIRAPWHAEHGKNPIPISYQHSATACMN